MKIPILIHADIECHETEAEQLINFMIMHSDFMSGLVMQAGRLMLTYGHVTLNTPTVFPPVPLGDKVQ